MEDTLLPPIYLLGVPVSLDLCYLWKRLMRSPKKKRNGSRGIAPTEIMSTTRKKLILALTAVLMIRPVFGLDWNAYQGYTIVGSKTIVGYIEINGSERKEDDSFDGCDFNRWIVFDDNTVLKCTGYNYQYAYRPDAILLVKHGNWVMIVEGEEYDMENVTY
jgi:hypothetical protein